MYYQKKGGYRPDLGNDSIGGCSNHFFGLIMLLGCFSGSVIFCSINISFSCCSSFVPNMELKPFIISSQAQVMMFLEFQFYSVAGNLMFLLSESLSSSDYAGFPMFKDIASL